MKSSHEKGIVDVPSNSTFASTLEKVLSSVAIKGASVFAVIDHSGEAEKVGLAMPPTKLVIFGNARAGTPVMLATPSIALDLPLKILVWEDSQGKVWISYNTPAYLEERHQVPPTVMQPLMAVEAIAAAAAK